MNFNNNPINRIIGGSQSRYPLVSAHHGGAVTESVRRSFYRETAAQPVTATRPDRQDTASIAAKPHHKATSITSTAAR